MVSSYVCPLRLIRPAMDVELESLGSTEGDVTRILWHSFFTGGTSTAGQLLIPLLKTVSLPSCFPVFFPDHLSPYYI